MTLAGLAPECEITYTMFKTRMNLFNMASFDALAYILPKPFKCVRQDSPKYLFLPRMWFFSNDIVLDIFTATLMTDINKM